jgi:hypothetical protein
MNHVPTSQAPEAGVGAAFQWVGAGVGSIGPGVVVALGTAAEVPDSAGVSEVYVPQSGVAVVKGAMAVMAAVAAWPLPSAQSPWLWQQNYALSPTESPDVTGPC